MVIAYLVKTYWIYMGGSIHVCCEWYSVQVGIAYLYKFITYMKCCSWGQNVTLKDISKQTETPYTLYLVTNGRFTCFL